MTRGSRPFAPSSTQSGWVRSTARKSGFTGSIAWARIPSARRMTGVRYRSASTKASPTRSMASAMDDGASTGTR